jgi:hypothetical protein
MLRHFIFLNLILLFAANVSAQCNPAPQPLPDVPQSLSRFFIIAANNTFTDSNFSGPLWGGRFDIDIMGRSAPQQEARRLEAIAFFNDRFGIDFTGITGVDVTGDSNPEWDTPDGKFRMSYHMTHDNYDNLTVPADFGQKVVYSGNETVPTGGWIVHEAYYKMEALVNGAEISGTYVTSAEVQSAYPAATTLPLLQYTFAVHGEYRIDYAAPCTGFIDLNFSSIRPTYPDQLAPAFGVSPTASFDYDVTFDPFDGTTGIARGTANISSTGIDTYRSKVRTVIKFTP